MLVFALGQADSSCLPPVAPNPYAATIEMLILINFMFAGLPNAFFSWRPASIWQLDSLRSTSTDKKRG